jgi:predicted RNase H-like nuclease (RuvC/YqgF family)
MTNETTDHWMNIESLQAYCTKLELDNRRLRNENDELQRQLQQLANVADRKIEALRRRIRLQIAEGVQS